MATKQPTQQPAPKEPTIAPAKYGTKLSTDKDINGKLDYTFQDGADIITLIRGKGIYNKAGNTIKYGGEIKLSTTQDGDINPTTGGMLRRVTVSIVEETAQSVEERHAKNQKTYWTKFVSAFGQLAYADMTKFIGGTDGFAYAFLKSNGQIGFEWNAKVAENRAANKPNYRIYAWDELTDDVKDALRKKLTREAKKAEKAKLAEIPTNNRIAAMRNLVELYNKQLMEGIADEAQRAAVTIARDNMLSEILKLTNPPAPRKGKAKAEAKADTTSATEAKN